MTVCKLIIVRKPKSPISEQYRTIRTNLEFTAVDDGFGYDRTGD